MKKTLLLLRDKMIYYQVGGAQTPDGSVFIHIPKTGGTNFVRGKRTHFTVEEYSRICPNYLFSNKIVAIYRKSEDRILSLLNYMLLNGNRQTIGAFADAKPNRYLKELLQIIQNEKDLSKNYDVALDLLYTLSQSDRMFWPSSKFVTIGPKMFATDLIPIADLNQLTTAKENSASYVIGQQEEVKSLIHQVYDSDDQFLSYYL